MSQITITTTDPAKTDALIQFLGTLDYVEVKTIEPDPATKKKAIRNAHKVEEFVKDFRGYSIKILVTSNVRFGRDSNDFYLLGGYSWAQEETLEELIQPERVKAIKEEFIKRTKRIAGKKKSPYLLDQGFLIKPFVES